MRAAWPRHKPRRMLDRRRIPIDTDNEGERHADSTGSLGSNRSSHFRVPAFERLCRASFSEQSGLESLGRVDLDSFGPSAPLSNKQETEITLPFPRSIVERRRFAAWRFRLFVVIGHRHFGAAPVRYADQFEWRGVFRPGRPNPAGHGAGSGRDHAHLDAAGQLRCHPRAGRERDRSSPRGAAAQHVRQQSAAVRSRTGDERRGEDSLYPIGAISGNPIDHARGLRAHSRHGFERVPVVQRLKRCARGASVTGSSAIRHF